MQQQVLFEPLAPILQAADDLGEEGQPHVHPAIAGVQPDDIGAPGTQGAAARVREIAQLSGGLLDPAAGLFRDAGIGRAAPQRERDGHHADARPLGDIFHLDRPSLAHARSCRSGRAGMKRCQV